MPERIVHVIEDWDNYGSLSGQKEMENYLYLYLVDSVEGKESEMFWRQVQFYSEDENELHCVSYLAMLSYF